VIDLARNNLQSYRVAPTKTSVYRYYFFPQHYHQLKQLRTGNRKFLRDKSLAVPKTLGAPPLSTDAIPKIGSCQHIALSNSAHQDQDHDQIFMSDGFWYVWTPVFFSRDGPYILLHIQIDVHNMAARHPRTLCPTSSYWSRQKCNLAGYVDNVISVRERTTSGIYVKKWEEIYKLNKLFLGESNCGSFTTTLGLETVKRLANHEQWIWNWKCFTDHCRYHFQAKSVSTMRVCCNQP